MCGGVGPCGYVWVSIGRRACVRTEDEGEGEEEEDEGEEAYVWVGPSVWWRRSVWVCVGVYR